MTGLACACGSPLPVIEVQGRSDDVLALAAPDGGTVAIVPLALETVIETTLGAVPFQLVAVAPNELRLRLARSGQEAPGAHARRECHRALLDFLVAHGLPGVKVRDDAGEPAIDARTGKLRRILAMPN
jgi:phenylacetate-coenzyme A ligase PaaK-like adenylate-forming protein